MSYVIPLTRAYLNANSKVDAATGCRVWTGPVDKRGYGRISKNEGDYKAHRLSLKLAKPSQFDDSLSVLHKCDNPPCIEPKHLFQGTQRVNMNDMAAKGRAEKGSDRHSAKLTEAMIPVIRSDNRPHGEIANDYGVCRSLISGIKRGTRWKHV